MIKTTLHTKPANGSTHWSVRTVAAETGISKSSVARYFPLFGLQPHRTEGFKLSNDPFFIKKLRDVVGLHLSPPGNSLVICFDEKSQCQALERTQPMLPMGFGYVEDVTHDDKRHGTTTLFAALNVLNGAVLASCKPRHRHQEFLSFLREIDKPVAPELDVHCIVDNYATHSHPKIKACWQRARTGTFTSYRPTAHGSIKSSDSSRSSPTRRFAAARSPASSNSCSASITSSPRTTQIASLSIGPLPLIRPWQTCIDFAHVSAGYHT